MPQLLLLLVAAAWRESKIGFYGEVYGMLPRASRSYLKCGWGHGGGQEGFCQIEPYKKSRK